MSTPLNRLRRFPLQGTTPAARQSRFRGVPGRGCAALASPEWLVRCAHIARVGVASFLYPHFSQGHGTPCHYTSFLTPHPASWATTRVAPTPSFLIPHSSKTTAEPKLRHSARSRGIHVSPALQLGCCDYAQHDGVGKAPLPPSPTPFPVFPHPSLLARARHALPLHQPPSPLTPHPSPLTPHSPHPSPLILTPHPSPLIPHSYDLTPPSSPLKWAIHFHMDKRFGPC